ncbi:heme ABC transporter permease/ATP-binding protein CydD [Testudinibacter aquarius]|uniref:ATP-binding cassette subfamily C protein CydD n=1 Tax=Testudinibacter aquarius TaxID=1524974 RepID=A0A4R3Y497_9PAST|nr:cysteine/glutathione ABC transporter permease/ATP-binding protein CydD [Testudinibacter aquarius]KAE9527981.1 thiol reductant ABC exporter subunit CydD [Testudinibacter aquarius]TCV86586.1 ATP-binding cassette subfamily C protein CydD [Testudinibacter aquarius]TNG93533.1 cysteine/glutathione ABC transporter permease/ATP-binding protein CydD [Testudinibacter aquarius]
MNKARQKVVAKWLRQQQKIIKAPLYFNILLGCLSAVLLIGQTWLLAMILDGFIIQQQPRQQFLSAFIGLFGIFVVRAIILYLRERLGFYAGQRLRQVIRQQVLDKLTAVGPVAMKIHPSGTWATIVLEQVENLHNFYARYLSQQFLSLLIPLIILIAVFPINWVSALILLFTAPLIPIFMALVGLKAAETSQRNITILGRLSGQFLDRLRGLETLRLFGRTEQTLQSMNHAADEFRRSTMDVLKIAFLSSAVLEFFTSISIAMMAVYFGFSYLGQISFGSGGVMLALFVGFFSLILAPEFYQPLRDLGTYYHDRAAAVAAADAIEDFLAQDFLTVQTEQSDNIIADQTVSITAQQLEILSPQGQPLSQPLNFTLSSKQSVALIGQSGAGKSSLLNVLLGFLPYRGSLQVNGIEICELNLQQWRQQIAWVGQNPLLLPGSIRENLLLGNPKASEQQLQQALQAAYAQEFTDKLGLDYLIREGGLGLSGGQAQRLAIARALLRHAKLLLLDEPTASLDATSESAVLNTLQQASRQQTTLMVTHRIEDLQQSDQIWVMRQGAIVQQGTFAELRQQDGYFAELLSERRQAID